MKEIANYYLQHAPTTHSNGSPVKAEEVAQYFKIMRQMNPIIQWSALCAMAGGACMLLSCIGPLVGLTSRYALPSAFVAIVAMAIWLIATIVRHKRTEAVMCNWDIWFRNCLIEHILSFRQYFFWDVLFAYDFKKLRKIVRRRLEKQAALVSKYTDKCSSKESQARHKLKCMHNILHHFSPVPPYEELFEIKR